MPGGFVCSGRLKTRWGPAGSGGRRGRRRLRKLFTKEQRAFYRRPTRRARAGRPVDPGPDLRPEAEVPGPRGYSSRKMVAEMWLYPDGSRSWSSPTKCLPAETFDTAAELRRSSPGRGVSASGERETRPNAFFGARLDPLVAGSAAVPMGTLTGTIVRHPQPGDVGRDQRHAGAGSPASPRAPGCG